MADKKNDKPEIIKFVKPEMDLYVAEEEDVPEKPEYKVKNKNSKWKSQTTKSGGQTVCTCDKVCTCNLVKSYSPSPRRRGRSGGGGYRRVCSCVPVAH